MIDTTPPMPTNPVEWETHWAFYKLTVMQRDHAWLEVERLTTENQRLREDGNK